MRTRSRQSGYSFIELMVVLAIVGILAVAGNYITAPRQKPAVQNLLAEVEGILFDAHKYADGTLGNVVIESTGAWNPNGAGFKLSFRQMGPATTDVNSLTSGAFPARRFAGIDSTGAGVNTAVGTETLASALAATPTLAAELGSALGNNLTAGGVGSVQINAFNKQFLTSFCIPVVGLRDGATYAGAPAGYVVVNGNRIYKFYKSGPGTQNPWRRL